MGCEVPYERGVISTTPRSSACHASLRLRPARPCVHAQAVDHIHQTPLFMFTYLLPTQQCCSIYQHELYPLGMHIPLLLLHESLFPLSVSSVHTCHPLPLSTFCGRSCVPSVSHHLSLLSSLFVFIHHYPTNMVTNSNCTT